MAATENSIHEYGKWAAERAPMAGDFAQFVAACYRLNCSGRIRGDWQTSRRTGLTSFVKACAVQRRVIGALLMREIQLRWGRRNLGFAWIFLEPLIFALPVLTMWSFMHSGMDRGAYHLSRSCGADTCQ